MPASALDAVAVPLELEGPARELGAERDRLGVDAVSPPDHHGGAMLLGAASDRRERALEPVEDEQAGFASLQGERRVEHVGRGQAEVEPAPVVPELFGDGIHERGEIVVRPLLDLGDALRCRRSRPLADARDRVGRNAPISLQPSSAASSTSSQRASLPSSDQMCCMAGRE